MFRVLLTAAVAAVLFMGAAPVASADTVGGPCVDWMKIGTDSSTGQRMFCAAPSSPARNLTWQPWTKGAWGSLSVVGPAGSPCTAPTFTFAQSSEGYVVWCAGPPQITIALLPGGQTMTNLKGPVWSVYSG
jgi:hypothetical protein